MIIGEPQRNYLHSRHKKAYNIKYAIYDYISKYIVVPESRILEMFGGIGINTYFVMKNSNPRLLRTYEVDSTCSSFLQETYKNNPIVEIKEEDSLNEIEDFNYIYIDGSNFSASNFVQYGKFLERISIMSGDIFITDSGYFKFRFVKEDKRGKKVREYYEYYNKVFNTYGLHLSEVYIGNEFAVLHLVREPVAVKLIYYKDETSEWQKVVTKFDSFIWRSNR